MAESTTRNAPEHFRLKKNILIVVMILELTYNIYVFVDAPRIAMAKKEEKQTEESLESLTTWTRVGAVINGLVIVAFFYGIAQHHICLVSNFMILQVITAVILVGCFFMGVGTLPGAAIAVIVACVAYLFFRDIRQMAAADKAGAAGSGRV